MRIRLIAVGGRETFELVATSNDKFSMTLKYRDVQLARLCCSRVHRIPRRLGGGTVKGPHVHYHRPGFGEKYAVATDRYSHDDVNGALSFFLELCGVTGIPPLQEMLDLI